MTGISRTYSLWSNAMTSAFAAPCSRMLGQATVRWTPGQANARARVRALAARGMYY